jgi:DtxR family Mn-dependent transcriptional regulator
VRVALPGRRGVPAGLPAGGRLPHRVLPELQVPFRGVVDVAALARPVGRAEDRMSSNASPERRTPAAAREEVLEELWTVQESGSAATVTGLLRTIHAGPDPGWGGVVQELAEEGMVTLGADAVALTGAGAAVAREVVRRHRLAEVLFHQVLELPMEETESQACRLEHILSAQVTDAVCSFLGHPPVCPHGRPIPSGPCCSHLSRQVAPLICRLADLESGEGGRVVLVMPRHRDRLEQLTDLGLMPGATVTLLQRRPSLVIEVDHTLLALEDEVAEGVYLRPLEI